jgi:outer membrane lipoprotein SlyB
MMERSTVFTACLLCLMAFLVGCSNGGFSRSDMNESISVRYGTVSNVQQIKLKSDAAKGAIAGGILGAVIGEDKVASAAIGAAAGGLLTKVAEGSDVGYQYTVEMTDGVATKIVTEAGNVRVGDCVAIEQGRSANIRIASGVHCEHAGHPGLSDASVTSRQQRDATSCHTAKQQALQAKTDKEIDLATKKVRALCEA